MTSTSTPVLAALTEFLAPYHEEALIPAEVGS